MDVYVLRTVNKPILMLIFPNRSFLSVLNVDKRNYYPGDNCLGTKKIKARFKWVEKGLNYNPDTPPAKKAFSSPLYSIHTCRHPKCQTQISSAYDYCFDHLTKLQKVKKR